jgi:hypothetical protein
MGCASGGVNPEKCVGCHSVTTSDLQTEKVFIVA